MAVKKPETSAQTPQQVLQRYWGYETFRPQQLEIINSVLYGHDTLGLLPTGGGKSITFQVPAMILPGLTVVVTPLISLMKDQVDNLRERGIRAVALYTGLSRREARLACDRCRLGKAKLLYVSPERLGSQTFVDMLRQWDVSLLVVDEAHCISQWGYDFRPAYLNIVDLRKVVGPEVPVLALTASATPQVRADIAQKLQFGPDAQVFTLSFDRSNLSYVVRVTDSKIVKLMQVMHATAGSAIIYVRSRAKTRQISEALQAEGISADFYHAGLDPELKAERQERWKASTTRVMVATNAFGMGIDKPDVRTVVHFDLPPSLEEYYQEAGRAGRDGAPAFAVLLVADTDKGLLTRRLNEAFPPKDYVKRIYELAGNFAGVAVGDGYDHVYEFDVARFCTVYNLQPAPVRGALALLTQAGYLEFVDDAPSRSRLMMICQRDELYSYRLEPCDEAVLTAVMRLYTGIFSEYVYVAESVIARTAGIDEADVYPAMLALGRQGILHYIPRKAIPYIYYTTARELPRYVQLPLAVYEHRRQLMQQRLQAVSNFAFSSSECRSQILLRYFGEEQTPECGRCDICRARRQADPKSPAGLEARILRMAAAPGGVDINDLRLAMRVSTRVLTDQLRDMAEHRLIRIATTRIIKI